MVDPARSPLKQGKRITIIEEIKKTSLIACLEAKLVSDVKFGYSFDVCF